MADMPYASTFQWQDYLVFIIMLLISTSIGLFFCIRARRQKRATAAEMLTGNKKLPVLPTALSLCASFTAATTILGVPSEVYFRGAEIWIWVFGWFPSCVIVAYVMVPIFYRLELTNAYEYLELRFNKSLRHAGSVLCSIVTFVYLAAVLFAPALALSQVTNLSPGFSILLIGLVCTFYTAVGGIRAVVWTDAFQLIIILTGILALMFKGASDAGGWEKVWEIARNGSRLPRFDMDPDPRIRHTFWSVLWGTFFTGLAVSGGNQINLQRYSSVSTMKNAQIALLLNGVFWSLYVTVLCLLGLVVYASFYDSDPMKTGIISQPDQLLPLFVLKSVGSHPGLPGLFVASIFSASISTLSSGINSLAAITLEDVVKPVFQYCKRRSAGNRTLSIATITLVILYGLMTIGMAYILDSFNRTALVISFGIFGMVGAPLVCLILGGLLIPCANSWGAGAGLVASLTACLYFGLDPILNPPPRAPNSQTTHEATTLCLNDSFTTAATTSYETASDPFTYMMDTNTTGVPEQGGNRDHFQLSYLHVSTVAFIISPVVTVIVSALTGFNKGRNVDERTFYKYSCLKKKERPESPQAESLLMYQKGPK